jgi:hypothetical protein
VFKILGDGMKSVNKFAQSKEFQKWAGDLGAAVGKGLKDLGPTIKKIDFKGLAHDLSKSGPAIVSGIKMLVDTVGMATKVTHWFVTTEPVLDNWFKNAHNVLVGNDKDTQSSVKHWDDLEASIQDWFTKSHQNLVDFGGTAADVLSGNDKDTQASIQQWNDLEDFRTVVVRSDPRRARQLRGRCRRDVRERRDLAGGRRPAHHRRTRQRDPRRVRCGLRRDGQPRRPGEPGLRDQDRLALPVAGVPQVRHLHRAGPPRRNARHEGPDRGASKKLADTVIGMFKSKDISRGAEQTALAALHSGTKQLEEIARKRSVVATKLQAAKTRLADALQVRKDYAAGIKSSTFAAGDVTQLGSAGDMVQKLHDLVAHTKQFRTIMRKLVAKGIDQGTYNELAQAGVAGGGFEAAQSLLANPLDLKQVVSLQRQLAGAGAGLGADTSKHRYNAAISTDRGRADDLSHLDRAYARQQRSVAASTVRRVERDVHVTVNLSGHVVGSKTELAKAVVDAIRSATRSGAISKDALKV